MGRNGYSRRDAAQPAAHGSTSRSGGDGRLDPVRWRRPGRGTLLRLAAVAALLATAAAVLWSPPNEPCGTGAASPTISGVPTPVGSASRGTNPSGGAYGPPSAGAGAGPGIPAGSVGVPIRLADPTALGLVRAGNRVDLLRIDDTTGRPIPVAGSALVLQVTGVNDPATGGLLVALTPQEASQAVVSSRQGFAIVIRPG